MMSAQLIVPHRVRWTRADFRMLEEAGLLPPRCELIEGDIVNNMGQKLPHRQGISNVTAWAYRIFNESFVQSQAQIDVRPEDNPTSEPEPDVCVLNLPLSELTDNPTPAQIALLIEISDATLRFDRIIKANLYARAQISEYWVLDLVNWKLIVHRDPVNGTYSQISELSETDFATPLASPGESVAVSTLLP